MRRATTLLAVLTLTSLVWANQASAFGWRGVWRGARYQRCHCPSPVAATNPKQASAETAVPTTIPASTRAAESAPSPELDEAAALARLLDVMKEIIELRSDRLDRELSLLEEDDDAYGSD